MRITKFGHACVRIEHDGVALVVDPGMFTQPEAVDGATAVLITHLHPDHYLPDHLRATDAPVFTVVDLADKIRDEAPDVAERVTVVATGEEFDPGLPVTAVGEWHNVIHPELPRPYNSGYLVTVADQRVYHPGDALTEPGVPVDVLLCPSSAPWLRSEMAIDFVRAVGAPRNLLGYHWLTDVLVAWALGLGWLTVVITAHRLLLTLRRRDAAGQPPGPVEPPDT
jgi:L-ascorbate metabolism protein UlaG (beta-lactamase superfamily)